MSDKMVLSILWTLAFTALICYFAARVSVAIDAHQWSSVTIPHKTTPHIWGR